MSGCSNSDKSTESHNDLLVTESSENKKISSHYNFSDNGELWNFFETLNQIVKEETNYKVYSNNDYTSYYYEIYVATMFVLTTDITDGAGQNMSKMIAF